MGPACKVSIFVFCTGSYSNMQKYPHGLDQLTDTVSYSNEKIQKNVEQAKHNVQFFFEPRARLTKISFLSPAVIFEIYFNTTNFQIFIYQNLSEKQSLKNCQLYGKNKKLAKSTLSRPIVNHIEKIFLIKITLFSVITCCSIKRISN